jgi:hypothetical protein
MLSALPNLADRAFVIGFLLPTLLSVVISLFVFGDPGQVQALLASAKEDTALLIVLIGAVWLLAVFMMLLNYWLYRFLEGYLPPLKWKTGLKKKTGKRISALRAEAIGLNQILADGTPRPKELARFRWVLKSLASLPRREEQALPTHFGNAIRAFEDYPREVYNADGVRLWLHVASSAPASLLATVAEARSQVDFMVNATFFSLLIAVAAAVEIVRKIWHQLAIAVHPPADFHQLVALLPWHDILVLIAALVAATLGYLLAVALVPAWGQAAMACFDLGLPELATRLGFKLPDKQEDRRRFWEAFSRAVVYRTNADRTSAFVAEDWLPATPSPGPLKRLLKWLW